MWQSGAPQRRVARGTPKGCRCTYALLWDIALLSVTAFVSIENGKLSYRAVAESPYAGNSSAMLGGSSCPGHGLLHINNADPRVFLLSQPYKKNV